jgi:murein DD-endopeptidase MepM/ murein hydrolase activator NlpD
LTPDLTLLEKIRKFPGRLKLWMDIAMLTMREPFLRIAGHVALLLVIGMGVWLARLGWDTLPADAADLPTQDVPQEAQAELPQEVQLASLELPTFNGLSEEVNGIQRRSELHTVFPERPRLDVIRYEVQQGDTVFGIAEKFNLKPESILWGNYDVLQDDPHRLKPGQQLNIPPVDGTLYTWHEGDGLRGVASFFGVEPAAIIEWPGNHLDPGLDPAEVTLEAGTTLIVPDGSRSFVTWSAPRITRSNPAVAKILGPGACGTVVDGIVGTSTFVWPAPSHYLSGYGYSSIHPAIDIAGDTGNAIFASDSGVVVYSGWNDWGYGYVVVLDHGNGWQTLYAHLSAINVGCGQSVSQGAVIAAMGSTGNSSGPHLHFEMMHDEYGKVNPRNFLP